MSVVERPNSVRLLLREARELGLGGTAYRVRRELAVRSGFVAAREGLLARLPASGPRTPGALFMRNLRATSPFAAPDQLAALATDWLSAEDRRELAARARDAAAGRIRAFGRWTADFGRPVAWDRDPLSGERWPSDVHWSVALRSELRIGDVKDVWEAARFPQAFDFARAAVLAGDAAEQGAAFAEQLESFVSSTPYPLGVHWASGQEIAIRWIAWFFALATFDALGVISPRTADVAAAHARRCADHLVEHLSYAQRAVHNNHLLAEALGIELLGRLLGRPPLVALGSSELERALARQFYPDGGYLQQSHTYERVALELYLLALAMRRRVGEPVPAEWLRTLSGARDFLFELQNEPDGRLPNYGSNDGAEPLPLAGTDRADFRPLLQAIAVGVDGTRLYGPGPWDETAAWLFGPSALRGAAQPVRRRSSRVFPVTGFAVQRVAPDTFGVLRCGTLRDRFSQIDMLHFDLWWRGLNVLADGGTYRYNGPDHEWHTFFMGTSSHNTVAVDGLDQMPHVRRFKTLFPTEARVVRRVARAGGELVVGEHYGFRRSAARATHRRSVLSVADGWIVVDHVAGVGEHDVRLHWLCGEFPAHLDAVANGVRLDTPRGEFHLAARVDAGHAPLRLTVGRTQPRGGWISRYYGERRATAAISLDHRGRLPVTLVTAMGPGAIQLARASAGWDVTIDGRRRSLTLREGAIEDWS